MAELLRIKGEILLARGATEAAEAVLAEALEMSRHHGWRGWELRVALSLGALWRAEGREAAAFDLLSEALAPFTEGAATADIARARGMLEEIGGGRAIAPQPRVAAPGA